MAWTAPRTWVADEAITAALFNTHLRDNLLLLSTHGHGSATTGGDGGDLFKTGDYIGDGASKLAITGLGYTPAYVKIMLSNTIEVGGGSIMRFCETTTEIIDDASAGTSIYTAYFGGDNGPNVVTMMIESLDTDGFTVSSGDGTAGHPANSFPNDCGGQYIYIAEAQA